MVAGCFTSTSGRLSQCRLYRATSLARVGPTAAAAEAVVATPVKPVIYLMKNQFHRENLQISGVPD